MAAAFRPRALGGPRRPSGLGLRRGLGTRSRLAALGEDLSDAHHRKLLTMPALTPRILASPLLEGDHLGAAALLYDLAGDSGAGHRGTADLDVVAPQEKDFPELDRVAALARETVDRDDVFGGDPVLLPAGLDDCEHLHRPRVRPGSRACTRAGFFSVDVADG